MKSKIEIAGRMKSALASIKMYEINSDLRFDEDLEDAKLQISEALGLLGYEVEKEWKLN